jgi:hypothetical protein
MIRGTQRLFLWHAHTVLAELRRSDAELWAVPPGRIPSAVKSPSRKMNAKLSRAPFRASPTTCPEALMPPATRHRSQFSQHSFSRIAGVAVQE